MQGRDIFSQILGIRHPWAVVDVTTDAAKQEVTVFVERAGDAVFHCMVCRAECPRYDSRRRRWRHLDTCQYRTIVEADVPRIECPEHGVQQVPVAWAEANSRFTGLFEALAINWLREASIMAVARLMRMTWKEVDGIMCRAVVRGLSRRELVPPERMGVDETSFQKRHEYVTVVTDLDGSTVLYVADDRKAESLAAFYRQLTPAQKKQIFVIAMDMHQPYISATKEAIPDADEKIAFDKFHVAKHLGDAVDKVRREEHQRLMAEDDWTLKHSKHLWLQNPENMDETMWNSAFKVLRESSLQTSRAWAIKELAMSLWNYASRGWATKAWTKWIAWARRCHLEPMKRVAAMVRDHLKGIVNAIVLQATNAASESINSKIQKVKRMACGFRNRERFRNAIYFHLGGLDLYPASAMATHTNG
jgi:transposase